VRKQQKGSILYIFVQLHYSMVATALLRGLQSGVKGLHLSSGEMEMLCTVPVWPFSVESFS